MGTRISTDSANIFENTYKKNALSCSLILHVYPWSFEYNCIFFLNELNIAYKFLLYQREQFVETKKLLLPRK